MTSIATQHRKQERGSALLLAVVVVAVLAVLSLAVVQMSGSETESVIAKQRHDRAVSCSDAARELLQSQFSTYGVTPTSITLNDVVGQDRLSTGHYDNIAVAAVVAATGSSSGSFGVSDMSNRIARTGLGGQVYRMTVVCSSAASGTADPSRQSELEFVVRFGL